MRPFLAALFLSLIMIGGLRGQQPGAKTSSDEAHAKEPYIMEFLSNKLRFEPDGRGSRELTFRLSVQSESAVREFGLLVYPFASSFESVEILYVRVRKPDGSMVETPPSEAQELDSAVSRAAPMYTDGREKHLAVKSLTVGDSLEASVRWTIHDPIATGHFWFDHSFFKGGTCLKEILEFDVPKDVPVTLRYSGAQPSKQEQGMRRVYSFQTSYSKPATESKIPDWEKNYHGAPPPDVQLSSFSSWAEVGSWFSALVQPKLAITPEIRAKSEELTRGKSTDEEKIRAIYSFVSQRFRYIGIDLGTSRYTPHSAAEVLTNRYGDCKDKHVLFAALLQVAGISANPALISSAFRIEPDFASPSLFDHVITSVSQNGSTIFLDTTPEVAPFGLLLANLRDRQALLIGETGNSHLVSTPAISSIPNYEIFRIESSIDVKGTLDAKMRFEDRGDPEMGLRIVYRATPQNRWEDLTQNIMNHLGFAGTVSDVSVAPPEDTEKAFWVAFSYHRTDYPDWKTHRISFPTPPVFLPELNEAQKLSKDPLPLGAPQEVTYISSVKFPAGFTPIVPEKVERKTDFAEFTISYSLEKDTLSGTFHFRTFQQEISGAQRTAFASFSKLINDTMSKYVFVQGMFPDMVAAMPLYGFAPGQAIPQLEEALKQDPDNPNVLTRLSRAYRDAKRPTDAVAILRKAIDAHPDDVPPHLYLELGTSYLAIPETEKAMAAFKKCLDGDPAPSELNTAAYALAEANVHLQEAMEYSTRAISALSSDSVDITPENAGPKEFGLMIELAANWDTLGWIKFQMGDLASAKNYLQAAWDIWQSATIGEHLVEVYEKLGEKQKAAAIANMASDTVLPTDDSGEKEKLTKELTRLRSFLKKVPSIGGGSSYEQGAIALSNLRMRDVNFSTKLQGKSATAQFVVSITNGPKIDKVAFLSGAEELRGATKVLTGVSYPNSLPDATPARILRKATLSCTIYTKTCTLVLMPAQEVPGSFRGNPAFTIQPSNN